MAGDGDAALGGDLTQLLDRLCALARGRGLAGVVLREQASLSWLLGARSHVPQTLDSTCFDLVVDVAAPGPARLTVLTNAIEAPRLRDTELARLDAAWEVLPWWAARGSALPSGPAYGADRSYGDTVDLSGEIAALRRRLTAGQAQRLRGVAADAAAATTAAVSRVGPRTSEYAAAAALADELLTRGLDPVVLLVAGADRIGPHGHPLPTLVPLGQRGMLVCCARRHGLIASVTRIVAFERVPDGDRDAYRRLLAVEAAFLDATRAGVRIGDAFVAGSAAYAANGFDPQEWHRHHQGGFTGWQPREYPASAASDDVVPDGSVVAWNVSGAGWKAEDTCLVGAAGVEPLVHDPTWPTVVVGGRARPDVLERP